MTSTVLARQHRPRDFAGLVGQEHVVRALSNALTQGRLHHAYLFTGTRGVGKTTVSRILAKSLNCVGADGQGGVTATPCGRCASCTAIDSGRFVDYVELDAASNRGVEEISALLDQAVYKPVIGRFKVYMIDEVHMLTNHAFNAMLKTLEEPPEYLKFVLATTDPQKVPPTVLSRCLQFNLRPMAPPTVAEHLARVLAQEAVACEPGALKLLARAARGSMRDALSLTDQAIAYGGGSLVEDAVMAIAQVAPGALDAEDPDEHAAIALADGWPADELQLVYSLLLNGQAELTLAPDEHAGLLMLLLRALAFRPEGGTILESKPTRQPTAAAATVAPSPSAPIGAPAGPKKPAPEVEVAPSRSASVPPWEDEPPSAPPDRTRAAVATDDEPRATEIIVTHARVTTAPLAEDAFRERHEAAAVPLPSDAATRWTGWVQALSDQGLIQALVRELALQAQCLALETHPSRADIRLRVEREPLRAPGLVEKLRLALVQWLGHEVTVEVESGRVDDSPALQAARRREARQQEAERLIHDDPVVQDLLRQFATARIVPGSIKPH